MRLTGIFQVLATGQLSASRSFYEDHFGLQAVFVADWYVHLAHPQLPLLQLGLVAAGHASIPFPQQQPNGAAIVTMQVDDVGKAFEALCKSNVKLLGGPRDEPWGQRHFFAVDPAGFLVDVVMMIEPTAEYANSYAGTPP
ncbi:MAG: VOC family protein [Alphaproteobacteria bacterium]|nr:VOC family protein [Alphaproteobacteria bacterium]MCW5739840.1 VOC family protein [Alphaproteobacteria bacterium]